MHQGVMSERLLAKSSCSFPWARGEQHQPTHSPVTVLPRGAMQPIPCHETSSQSALGLSWPCLTEVNFRQMGLSSPALEDLGAAPPPSSPAPALSLLWGGRADFRGAVIIPALECRTNLFQIGVWHGRGHHALLRDGRQAFFTPLFLSTPLNISTTRAGKIPCVSGPMDGHCFFWSCSQTTWSCGSIFLFCTKMG